LALKRIMALLGLSALVLANDPALAARKKPKPEVVAPVAPSVRAGVDLWRTGDYAGAVAIWQPFALAGDKDALFNMGQAYKLGRAVPKDSAQALDYFRRAALLGHLPAQANLGIMLFQAGEKPEAIKWLKAAADKNEMRAQYVLGVALWNGDGVPRSLTLAYAYLARSSALGMPEATTALNTLTGVISPLERANGWAVATSIAAGNGVPPAFAGSGVPPAFAGSGGPPAFAGSGARTAVASSDSYSRDQVIKPLPKPVADAAPPVIIAAVPPAMTPVTSPLTVATPIAKPAPVVATPAPAIPRAVANPPQLQVPIARPPVPVPVTAPIAVPVVAAAKPVAVSPPRPTPLVPPPVETRYAAPVVAAQAAPAPKAVPVERPPTPAVTTVAIPAAASPPAVTAPAPAKPVVAAPKPVVVAAAPKPAPQVEKKPAGWRVQLGAFSKKAQAEAAWTDVKTKQKQLVADKKPIFEADGNVTKLQLGPYPNKTAARDACAKIAFSGRACFVTEG
jgi:hypothetical protein